MLTRPSQSPSRFPVWLLGAAIVAVALLSAAWLWACLRIERDYRDVVAAAVLQGWTIAAATTTRAGWPFAAEIDVPAVSVTGDDAAFPGGMAWSAERIRLRLDVVYPATLVVLVEGAQTLRIGPYPPIPITASSLTALVPLDGAAPPVLAAAGLRADFPFGPVAIRAAHLQLQADGATLEAQGITAPLALAHGPDPLLDELRVRAVLSPVPPGTSPARRARDWRAAGGTLDLPEIAFRAGPLVASGRAALRLDARLQPEGDGTLDVTGQAAALDMMAQAGVVPRQTAMAAKAVLALLAAPARGGPVRLPVQIRDGLLIVARFPLLRLPALDWGPP